MALYHQKKKKIKEKNIVWTEFPQSRRAAEKDGNKDSALGKLLLRKKKAKNTVRVKRETRPRLWELGSTRTLFSGRALSKKTARTERELNLY